MEDLTGKQLGPYQVVAPLGEGGMAAVYKAFQPGVERYVALKILPRHYASDPEFVGRFHQEAKVLAHLQHPHILPVFDYGEADGYTYIVMPFLQNGDLTDLLKGEPLPLPEMRRIIAQVGDALDYAHQQGLVHRDVKPNNVLLDERGNCLLSDFGITKIVEGTAKFTVTGGIIGTPDYMSPEQGQGVKLDGRSDIYSLGVMLYQMATGRVPYRADTPLAVLVKHVTAPLPPPSQLNPNLPEAVEKVILKSLAKKSQDRFATAGEMVQAVQMAIPETVPNTPIRGNEDQTIKSTVRSSARQSVPITTAEPQVAPRPDFRSNSKWILIGVAVILALAAVGGLAFWLGSRAFQPNEASPVAAVNATPTPDNLLTAAPIRVVTNTPRPFTPTAQPETATPIPTDPINITTPELTPTSSSTPMPIPKTSSKGDQCADAPSYFEDVWKTELRLGCPQNNTRSDFTFQNFERGLLVWQKSPNPATIYGLFNSNDWERVTDPGGPPVPSCPEAEQTDGLGPILGFGTVWCDPYGWKARLGQPLTKEQDGKNNPIQQFEEGVVFTAGDAGGFILYADGGWEPFPTAISTLTPTPTLLGQNCNSMPAGEFVAVWNSYRSQIGCPVGSLQVIPTIAEEVFQGGHLFWRSDTDAVYVIYDRNKNSGTSLREGQWTTNPAWKWDGSNPDGVGLFPPPGLVEPKRGFGWLWRTHLGGADGPLGWALDKEYGFDNTGMVQPFEQGAMFKGSSSQIYVLLSDDRFYAP